MKAPCINCEERYPACHDSCDRYKEWKKEIDRKRLARQDFLIKKQNERVYWNRKRWS